ncbi:MAG: hypothetical protein COB96_07015 [Planctomycetota bacterium]|nr:MAG: hypothetical protein COB96_07015 [Planctomycetota bacterium]
MVILTVPAICLAIFPQERPLVRGTYRGPYDEVLAEQVAAAKDGIRTAALLDGWERWEFWFEHERGALFSEPARLGHLRLNDYGAYGSRDGSLTRDEVVGQAVPLLLAEIDSPFPGVREAAALALGRIGEANGLDALKDLATDPIAQVRQAAFLGLGLLDNDRALVFLAEHWSDPGLPTSDRCFAAIGIGLSSRREGGELLKVSLDRNLKTDRLFGSQEKLLQALIWAAGLQGSEDFVPQLMEAFGELESSAASASRRVRGLICWALGAIGDPSARPWLSHQLHSNDLLIQRASAQALGALGDPASVPALAARLLEGGDIQTMMNCMFAAGRLGGASSEVVFKRFADASTKHRQLRAAWGLGVGLSQSDSQADALFSAFVSRNQIDLFKVDNINDLKIRRDEERLRGAIALGLGFYGDQRAVVQLGDTLAVAGINPDFAGYLCMALGRLGGDKALASMKKFYDTSSAQVDARRGLAFGLGLHGSKESAAMLARLLIDDRDYSVRRSAAEALRLNRDAAAFNQVAAALRQKSTDNNPHRRAHLVLSLGYMGDPYVGDRLAAMIEFAEFRQEFPLLRALSTY